MGIIKKLSSEVISHIAAGQVVERPSSIVKELLENSLDARAKNITIRITDGGKKKIVVTDDGIGMEVDDVRNSIETHTTSKISSLDDLQTIQSYGFRGEALASIGRSSRLTLQSKVKKSALGTKIVLSEDGTSEQTEIGMNPGTVVIAEDLFFHLPARKKFLKSAQTEFQYILELVTEFALAYPAVGFQLFHNDHAICDYLPNQRFEERCELIFGQQLMQHFLPVSFSIGPYTLTGLLGTPQAATQISQKQMLFVNQRPVHSLHISKTVKRAFGSLLPPAIQPPFILFISSPPELIDVNTHPRKETVSFEEQGSILDMVYQAVIKTLEDANLTFRFEKSPEYIFDDSGMDAGTAQVLRENVTSPWNVKNYFENEPILQIKKLYLLVETKDGVMLIDQHAAHERILYEEFLESYQNQQDQQPETVGKKVLVEFPVLEAELLEANQDVFSRLGFIFTRTNQTTFSFTSIPVLFKTRAFSQFILEVLQDIRDQVPVQDIDLVTHKTIAYLACRTAIKAGEVLTQQERHNLIQKLLATKSNYTCPHGRPVTVVMSHLELAQLFHRIPASRKEK